MNQGITRGFSSADKLNILRYGRQSLRYHRGLQIHYSLGGNTIVVNPLRGRVITMVSSTPGTRKGLGAGYKL